MVVATVEQAVLPQLVILQVAVAQAGMLEQAAKVEELLDNHLLMLVLMAQAVAEQEVP
jgi:tetrahydromethanopterin S-methyltransferase subunit C